MEKEPYKNLQVNLIKYTVTNQNNEAINQTNPDLTVTINGHNYPLQEPIKNQKAADLLADLVAVDKTLANAGNEDKANLFIGIGIDKNLLYKGTFTLGDGSLAAKASDYTVPGPVSAIMEQIKDEYHADNKLIPVPLAKAAAHFKSSEMVEKELNELNTIKEIMPQLNDQERYEITRITNPRIQSDATLRSMANNEKELTQSVLYYARENKTSVKNVMDPYNKFSPLDKERPIGRHYAYADKKLHKGLSFPESPSKANEKSHTR